VPGRPPIAGNVTWPSSFDGADSHAGELLQVAEAGLAESCVADRAPAFMKADVVLVESYVDLEEVESDLAHAKARWSTAPKCR
jgi:hypothetical protein